MVVPNREVVKMRVSHSCLAVGYMKNGRQDKERKALLWAPPQFLILKVWLRPESFTTVGSPVGAKAGGPQTALESCCSSSSVILRTLRVLCTKSLQSWWLPSPLLLVCAWSSTNSQRVMVAIGVFWGRLLHSSSMPFKISGV